MKYLYLVILFTGLIVFVVLSTWLNLRKEHFAEEGAVSELLTNASLDQGKQLVSPNKRFTATMETDGVLRIRDDLHRWEKPWQTKTGHGVAGPYKLSMQDDGNLVVYGGKDRLIWDSDSHKALGKRSPFRLVMKDNGNLVVYDSKNKPLWTSNTQKYDWKTAKRVKINPMGQDKFCVEVISGSKKDGPVRIWGCKDNGFDNQRWIYDSKGQTLRSEQTGNCLLGNYNYIGHRACDEEVRENRTHKSLKWQLGADGSIRPAGYLSRCMDTNANVLSDGTPLVLKDNCPTPPPNTAKFKVAPVDLTPPAVVSNKDKEQPKTANSPQTKKADSQAPGSCNNYDCNSAMHQNINLGTSFAERNLTECDSCPPRRFLQNERENTFKAKQTADTAGWKDFKSAGEVYDYLRLSDNNVCDDSSPAVLTVSFSVTKDGITTKTFTAENTSNTNDKVKIALEHLFASKRIKRIYKYDVVGYGRSVWTAAYAIFPDPAVNEISIESLFKNCILVWKNTGASMKILPNEWIDLPFQAINERIGSKFSSETEPTVHCHKSMTNVFDVNKIIISNNRLYAYKSMVTFPSVPVQDCVMVMYDTSDGKERLVCTATVNISYSVRQNTSIDKYVVETDVWSFDTNVSTVTNPFDHIYEDLATRVISAWRWTKFTGWSQVFFIPIGQTDKTILVEKDATNGDVQHDVLFSTGIGPDSQGPLDFDKLFSAFSVCTKSATCNSLDNSSYRPTIKTPVDCDTYVYRRNGQSYAVCKQNGKWLGGVVKLTDACNQLHVLVDNKLSCNIPLVMLRSKDTLTKSKDNSEHQWHCITANADGSVGFDRCENKNGSQWMLQSSKQIQLNSIGKEEMCLTSEIDSGKVSLKTCVSDFAPSQWTYNPTNKTISRDDKVCLNADIANDQLTSMKCSEGEPPLSQQFDKIDGELTEVLLYDKKNFEGNPRRLVPGKYEHTGVVLSMKIPVTMGITLYDEGRFYGRNRTFLGQDSVAWPDLTQDAMYYPGTNNKMMWSYDDKGVMKTRIKSHVVFSLDDKQFDANAKVLFYDYDHYEQSKVHAQQSTKKCYANKSEMGFDEGRLSSIRIPQGYKVTLYQENNCPDNGAKLVLYTDTPQLKQRFHNGRDWNDKTRSFKIE